MGMFFLQIQFDFLSIVDVFSFTNAFMLGVLFIAAKSGNKKANIFLGLSLLCLSGEVLDVLSEVVLEQNFFIIKTSLLTLPFLLFYTNQTIRQKIKPWFFLLFIPAIIENGILYFFPEQMSLLGIDYIFNLAVLSYILYVLKKHRIKVSNFYSDIENKTLKWMKIMAYIFIGFNLLWILEDLIPFENEIILAYFAAQSGVLTLFTIYWIGYNGFSQAEIFKQKIFVFADSLEKVEPEIEQVLSKDKETFIYIQEYLISSKAFTNPKLNLATLSKGAKLKEKEVSRIINQQANCNFYQFINQYRVQEYKKMLVLPRAKQLSTLGIAEEAGFSSKSTFYTAFKSIEGVTPKQYELSVKESE